MTALTFPGWDGPAGRVATSDRAGDAGLPRAPGAEDRHQAWLRAMEQAQLGAWFGHDGPGDASRAPRRPPPASPSAELAARPPAPRGPAPTAALAAPPRREAAHRPGGGTRGGGVALPMTTRHGGGDRAVAEPVGPSLPPPGGEPPPRSARRAAGPTATARAELPVPPTRLSQAGAPARDPVRVHAEWSDEGVRLWLGVDAEVSSLGELPGRLVAQLRQELDATGGRLLAIVCNGRPLWAADAPASTATDAPVPAPCRPPSNRDRSEASNPVPPSEETP
jgi:hypothetical protein